jgi:SP family general alpha glucoside:H+ symporter-like MFS transporter
MALPTRVIGEDVAPVDPPTVRMDEKDHEAMAHEAVDHTKAHSQMIHNAKSATEKEHKMTLMQGVRLYPKAIAWSVLISTCIVMEGYDVCLINNFCE